jgi:hypothetical protein
LRHSGTLVIEDRHIGRQCVLSEGKEHKLTFKEAHAIAIVRIHRDDHRLQQLLNV